MRGKSSMVGSILGGLIITTMSCSSPSDPISAKYTLAIVAGSHSDNAGLHLVNELGEHTRALVDSLRVYWAPQWSPEGSRIAFVARAGGGQEKIYILDLNGLTVTRVLNASLNDTQPAWSPDGNWLAFSSYLVDSMVTQIFKVPAHGGNPTQLTFGPVSSIDPAWSPNGARIAFTTMRDTSQIAVINNDGSDRKQITNSSLSKGGPQWSLDGLRIYYSASSGIGDSRICVVDSAGGNEQTLALNSSYHQISPDGSRIVFSSPRDGTGAIWIMNADGTNQVRITDGSTSNPLHPGWSPDGTMIAFANHVASPNPTLVYVAKPDGSGRRMVSTKFPFGSSPRWSPTIRP